MDFESIPDKEKRNFGNPLKNEDFFQLAENGSFSPFSQIYLAKIHKMHWGFQCTPQAGFKITLNVRFYEGINWLKD